MKRLFFGAFVAVIALSASAFTNAKNLTEVKYYQNANDEWVQLIGSGPVNMCSLPDTEPCTYTFQDASIVEDFPTFTKEQITSEALLSTYNGSSAGSELKRTQP